jgi:hypothetical protein
MNHIALCFSVLALVALLGGCRSTPSSRNNPNAPTATDSAAEMRNVATVLNSLHDAASKADGPRYFALFAPEAIFLGTDATERWTIDQFKAYAQPLFAKGRGWTYTCTFRDIVIRLPDTATFDELLTNAKYGTCRGSGSLRRTDAGWKITQYNLSVPIPNDLLEGFAIRIRDFERDKR